MKPRNVVSSSLRPGLVIDDRWELLTPLATGSSGEVFAARERGTGRDAAVKVMRSDLLGDEVAVKRFEREAQATGSIAHPNVVPVIAHGHHRGRPYLAMELLRGETLEARLARGPVPRAQCLVVVAQIAAALDAAHAAGVIHRDLKPDNVFLLEGDAVAVRVLDFGYAKLADHLVGDANLTAANALLGTPLYMAPEQVQASREVDARADLWSLGVIAYELVVGRAPFPSTNVADLFVEILARPIPLPSAIDPSLPRGLDAWSARALARPREERYPTATALAEALAVAARPGRWPRALAVAGLVVAAIALALAVARSR
jgi:serine/threonine-protein kinase